MKNTPRAIMALIIAGLWIFIQFYDGRPVLPSFNIEGMGYFLAAVGVPIILVVYGLKELLKSK